MNKVDFLKQQIQLAEEATSTTDVNLREKAFEIVLNNLLQVDSISGSSSTTRKKSPNISKGKPNPKRKVTELRNTSIELDEKQLKGLVDFYNKYLPNGGGGEVSMFILANYLVTEINIESFHEGDIGHCYQQLLNLGVSTLPALTMVKIKERLNWLCAPSRQKQWLKLNDDDLYVVTPVGKIEFNKMKIDLESSK